MAAGDNNLFHIDTILADGKILAFEDSSGMLSGAAGYKNEPTLSASGDDFVKRTRVARQLKAKLQFGPLRSPEELRNMNSVQITMRDQVSKRKVIANNCTFGELGDIGGGTVDVTFLLLSDLQWL
jgi:hypothetical protein